MQVVVYQTRRRTAPAQIDAPGLPVRPGRTAVAADGAEAAPAHGHGRGRGLLRSSVVKPLNKIKIGAEGWVMEVSGVQRREERA